MEKISLIQVAPTGNKPLAFFKKKLYLQLNYTVKIFLKLKCFVCSRNNLNELGSIAPMAMMVAETLTNEQAAPPSVHAPTYYNTNRGQICKAFMKNPVQILFKLLLDEFKSLFVSKEFLTVRIYIMCLQMTSSLRQQIGRLTAAIRAIRVSPYPLQMPHSHALPLSSVFNIMPLPTQWQLKVKLCFIHCLN